MFTKRFWKLSAERAVKSAANGTLTGLALSNSGPVNAFAIDWQLGAGFALSGAVISVLMSLASSPLSADPTSPSFVNEH